jgi:hypothetical protein
VLPKYQVVPESGSAEITEPNSTQMLVLVGDQDGTYHWQLLLQIRQLHYVVIINS